MEALCSLRKYLKEIFATSLFSLGKRAMGSNLAKELDKNKKKESVDLRKRGIQELPPNISNLKCKELLLAENDITTLPDEIGKMAYLETLDASNNRLNGLPFEIGQIRTLKELNLSYNKLFFSPLSPALGKLASLTKLDLSNNQLDELPSELGNLASLQTFILANNQLKVFPPELGKF